ncbi:jerky-like protein [Trichonephila inaurata madagascariensis]|uniref:Jerky-like protein n=1 Tax=Trichonephila inaurata madagascariensis TaxID=2747483 RepID=A0A8X6MMG7_9ARAC|nr:jerky-like protein [Trichonephila inaurata madagascariensis]
MKISAYLFYFQLVLVFPKESDSILEDSSKEKLKTDLCVHLYAKNISGIINDEKIRELQIADESLSGDKNSAHKFKETFLQHVEGEGYSRDDIYDVNETGVNCKALPRKSLASKQEYTAPGFKVSKECLTAMVYANARGTYTLPLLVIDKSKKPRYFKNVSYIPTLYKT